MSRKEIITKDMIMDTAFLMMSEEGIEHITARKIASKANCSTQPIFRIYKNMDELQDDLYQKMIDFFSDFYRSIPKKEDTPFVNLGYAYIKFAEKEKHLFRALFLSEKRGGRTLYELLNGTTGALVTEINKARAVGVPNPSELFMKMWIFIHGAACMVTTGDYDLSEEETIMLLKDSFQAYADKK